MTRRVHIPVGSAELFIRESNAIEGIFRDPTIREINEYVRFMRLSKVTVEELEAFVSVYQPNASLRIKVGMDVRIGNHIPPAGDPAIKQYLEDILPNPNKALNNWDDAWKLHIAYETLHPFTDCNGRSGRMLWRWMCPNTELSFLHAFYYATLSNVGRSNA